MEDIKQDNFEKMIEMAWKKYGIEPELSADAIADYIDAGNVDESEYTDEEMENAIDFIFA